MQNYTLGSHFPKQLAARQVAMHDALCVLRRSGRVEAYARPAEHGGSAWRVIGKDLDGTKTIAVGVEAFTDDDGTRRIYLCTVFVENKS